MLLWSSLKPYSVVKALHALAERKERPLGAPSAEGRSVAAETRQGQKDGASSGPGPKEAESTGR